MHNSPDSELARILAQEVCDQWRLAQGRDVLSADDLARVKEWLKTAPGYRILPTLHALAAKGIDRLQAREIE